MPWKLTSSLHCGSLAPFSKLHRRSFPWQQLSRRPFHKLQRCVTVRLTSSSPARISVHGGRRVLRPWLTRMDCVCMQLMTVFDNTFIDISKAYMKLLTLDSTLTYCQNVRGSKNSRCWRLKSDQSPRLHFLLQSPEIETFKELLGLVFKGARP